MHAGASPACEVLGENRNCNYRAGGDGGISSLVHRSAERTSPRKDGRVTHTKRVLCTSRPGRPRRALIPRVQGRRTVMWDEEIESQSSSEIHLPLGAAPPAVQFLFRQLAGLTSVHRGGREMQYQNACGFSRGQLPQASPLIPHLAARL
jgi:hypothetical protein